MKNLNNELGFPQFKLSKKQFTALSLSLSEKNITDKSAERAFVLDTFAILRHEHDICNAVGGDTGSKCPDSKGWKKVTEVCPVAQSLKEIYIDYMEQGFIHIEFMMVAWSAICECQMTEAIGHK
jgi:hypothetical protein